MIKKILITGGAGYIGSHISEILIKKKKKIFIIDNLSTGYKKLINKKAKFFKADIQDLGKIKNIIKENKIDSIIHLAAVLSVGESQKKPKKYNKINVTGTKRLLFALKGTTVKNIIFSSTCAVYKDGLSKVSEKSPLKPTSVYGKTKLKGEKLIESFAKKNKINFGILRFFNVVGASTTSNIGQIKKGDQLFKNLSLEIKKKNPVFKIYGTNYKTKDGTCIRDYIHVSDIAEIHYKVLEKIDLIKRSKILNCGYGNGLSVNEVVNEFKKFSNKNVKVVRLRKRKGDMVKITANNKSLYKFIKWRPKFKKLNIMVKSSLKWEKINSLI
jgi:UDP-glucose 4-epimerase